MRSILLVSHISLFRFFYMVFTALKVWLATTFIMMVCTTIYTHFAYLLICMSALKKVKMTRLKKNQLIRKEGTRVIEATLCISFYIHSHILVVKVVVKIIWKQWTPTVYIEKEDRQTWLRQTVIQKLRLVNGIKHKTCSCSFSAFTSSSSLVRPSYIVERSSLCIVSKFNFSSSSSSSFFFIPFLIIFVVQVTATKRLCMSEADWCNVMECLDRFPTRDRLEYVLFPKFSSSNKSTMKLTGSPCKYFLLFW